MLQVKAGLKFDDYLPWLLSSAPHDRKRRKIMAKANILLDFE